MRKLSRPIQTANISSRKDKLRVIPALALVAIIFALSVFLANQAIPLFGDIIDSNSFAQKNSILKIAMLILTLLAMWILSKKNNLSYGFTWGKNLNYVRFTFYAIGLGLAGLFAVILCNLLYFVITKNKPVGFPDEHIIDRILFIWLLSSVVEEILFRGLFQSMIRFPFYPVFTFRNASISLAVLFSALSFAAIHLSLLLQGMNVFFVIGIFINTLLLGFLAGYLRERTGSLYPAIYVHIIFNIIGSSPLLLKFLILRNSS